MRTIIRINAPDGRHMATLQRHTDPTGNQLYTCDCGRSGWGVRGILIAHQRPAQITGPYPEPARAPIFTKDYWWNPMFDNRKDRREHLFWRLWQRAQPDDPNAPRLPQWRVRIAARGLCAWYGHQESARVPGVCYFCQRRRRRFRPGTWRPAPTADPQLRPGEREPEPRPPVPVRPIGGPLPAHRHGPRTRPEDCPICMRRTR